MSWWVITLLVTVGLAVVGLGIHAGRRPARAPDKGASAGVDVRRLQGFGPRASRSRSEGFGVAQVPLRR